jgi:cobalt-zinc-cadmium efflux system outer membrane protein
MRVAWTTLALIAALLSNATVAVAQVPLTLAEALARARERAPQIVSARLAIEESRARLTGADHLQSNPEFDVGVGNRQGTGTRSTDIDIGIGQSFEPGSRRASRRDMAAAGIEQSTANVDEVTRAILLDSATLFLRGLHLSERVRLLDRSLELANNILQIADRRFQAGDVAVLDVNIARSAAARIRAERQGMVAERAIVIGELRELLQLEDEIELLGDLPALTQVDRATITDAASRRPELRALEAAIREAEAEQQFGRSFTRADYGFAARYQREEGDNIILGGLTLSLPMFSKGQEPIAAGLARASRLRAELSAVRIRIGIEVQAALHAYDSRAEAVRILERDALPGLDESVTLATRSFEVGQIGLAELLLIRREIIDTRTQYVDALLEAALARIELDARAGVLR